MKKIIVILLSLVTAFGAMACQATPGESIVKGKDLDKMIEAATSPRTAHPHRAPSRKR